MNQIAEKIRELNSDSSSWDSIRFYIEDQKVFLIESGAQLIENQSTSLLNLINQYAATGVAAFHLLVVQAANLASSCRINYLRLLKHALIQSETEALQYSKHQGIPLLNCFIHTLLNLRKLHAFSDFAVRSPCKGLHH